MLISDSSGILTPRCNGLVVAADVDADDADAGAGADADAGARPFDVLKLCLHVGHVLFIRSHSIKLSELNMCPQCRMRATRCVGSNVSCVMEHTVFNGSVRF
jgi:hypothetical protein